MTSLRNATRHLALLALLLTALVLAACGGSDPAGFASPCDSSDDCEESLTCGTFGSAAGLCTYPCSENNTSVCAAQFGEGAYCSVDDTCLLRCTAGCPDGTTCNTYWIPDTCERADD